MRTSYHRTASRTPAALIAVSFHHYSSAGCSPAEPASASPDHCFDNHPRSSSLYDRAAEVWAARIVAARREAMNWRLAALGSMSLTALLGLAIAMSAGRASVVRYVTEVQSLPEVATAKVALEPERTLHTQIVFPWDQSSTNTPSLSIDLATIRERWLDAYSYDYVEDREVETFNDYNRADGSLARPLSSVRHRRNHPWH